MNTMHRRGLAVCLLFLVGGAGAQQAMPEASGGMPETSGGPAADCPVLLQEAEAHFEQGHQAASAKRWKEAQPLLHSASGEFLKVAAACPTVAAQANRQGDRATTELKLVEAAISHQSECLPRFDKALDLDLRAAAAKSDKGDPAEVERLLAEGETTWREAVAVCQSPHREKAEKSLAATVKVRTANAELLSAGPACDAAWKNATALIDYAKGAWRDKRWDDAAMLYGKAVMAWEGAADKCSGTRQLQAQRKVEQTQIDAHNAEFCGPLWDSATDLSQRVKSAGNGVSATEKDQLSMRAEVAWRDAAGQCHGSPQNLARSNADALARERGTPLPVNAQALYGTRRPAPVVEPVAVKTSVATAATATAAAALPVAKDAIKAGAATTALVPVVPTPVGKVAEVPAATVRKEAPTEATLVAGDTTYKGHFAMDPKSGIVSGTGTVEWANGERFSGTLVDGRRQGKGRFNWVGGQWYDGDWADDRAVGYGIIQFPGGNRYEGAVVDGEPVGRGTLVFASGDRYTGDFVRGLFHGQGSYAWKNGNRYDGAWNLGKKHGRGRLTWASGDAWEGEFRDDLKTESGQNIAVAAH
ncbi:MAG: hypothetical protein JSS57_23430 [Proteobacteria bacterium]|nr:hypothetical protein [Pseudomonadota bacterium]